MVDAVTPHEHAWLVRFAEARGLDSAWLFGHLNALRRDYFFWRKKEKQHQSGRPTPRQAGANIKALRQAEAIFANKPLDRDFRDFQQERIVDALRVEAENQADYLKPRPAQRPLDFCLDYVVWIIAKNIKRKTGSFHWELIADLVTVFLETRTQTKDSAQKRFARFDHSLKQGKSVGLESTGLYFLPPQGFWTPLTNRQQAVQSEKARRRFENSGVMKSGRTE